MILARADSTLIWAGAVSVAAALHLALVQQGLAAYDARNLVPPPPAMPQVEILAVANSVAGQDQPVETVAAVANKTLTAISSADRASAARATPVAPSVSANTAARVAAVAAGPSASIAARPAPGAAQPARSTGTATASASAAVASPVAPLSPAASTVTPSRPAPVSMAAVTSTASISARPTLPRAGLTPPAVAPAAVAGVTRRPPSAPANAPAANRVAAALVAPAGGAVKPVSPAPKSPALAAINPAPQPAPVAPPPKAAPQPDAARTTDPVVVVANPPSPTAQDGVAAPPPKEQLAQTADDNTQTYQSVLDALAALPRTPCFAALPSLSDQSIFQLEVFARTADQLSAFSSDLSARIGALPNTTMKAISAAQCAATAFVTEGPSYPRFKLFFDLPRREIKSGEALEGRIGNTGGGFVSFLVIDDEGIVQDLASYLQFVPGGARFRIPLSLTGSPVVTQQLLMAISSPSLLQTVIDLNGSKAETFFPALAAELRDKGQSEDVALVAFSVE